MTATPMTATDVETRTVTVEREIAHPPEKVWRALTQPHLMAEWLMKTDFVPTVGHLFDFSAEWGAIHCKVQAIEPERMLAYTWGGMGLESVVTWTLSPLNTGTGTRLRMEQTGFRPDQKQAYHGAKAGWPRFLGNLENVLAQMD